MVGDANQPPRQAWQQSEQRAGRSGQASFGPRQGEAASLPSHAGRLRTGSRASQHGLSRSPTLTASSLLKIPVQNGGWAWRTNHRDAHLPRRARRPLKDARASLRGVPTSSSGGDETAGAAKGPSRRTASSLGGAGSSEPCHVAGESSRGGWGEEKWAGGLGDSLRPDDDGVVMEPRGRARACATLLAGRPVAERRPRS
ncbi:hypothetical protein J1605_019217 [Eschrichtius robustus]|uniref:Uncharacterized protein n=1 Tax=Eschrichtius robustus TaxID=9764 RepID=A0AB34HLX1_ESCRO|nr:hypothetical protein J1605_019217 [Eschrichtius robustus]